MKADRSSRTAEMLFAGLAVTLLLLLVWAKIQNWQPLFGMHDTFFAIAPVHLLGLPALGCALFSAAYGWSKRSARAGRLIATLTWTHVLTTVAFLIGWMVFFTGTRTALSGTPRRYYSYDGFPMFDDVIDPVAYLPAIVTVLAIGQVAFLINITASALRGPSTMA